jgi:5-formyltetrahydrofolate cyclo-ligase
VTETDDADALKLAKLTQRREARECRKSLTAEYRESASRQICTHICSSSTFARAATVASYEWMHSEVQTSELNEAIRVAGKRLIVPEVTGPTSMRFLWFEDRTVEVDLAEADMIVVPCVGFDLGGNRIGNGRGYYDRALAAVSGLRACVAFDAQRIDRLTVEPTDTPMHVVMTESGPIVGEELWA